MIDDLLSSPLAQQAFELWMSRGHVSINDQETMKRNAQLRQAELVSAQKQADLHTGGGGPHGTGALDDNYDGILEETDHHDHTENDESQTDHDHPRDADDGDEDDVMAAFRKRKKSAQRELKEATRRGDIKAKQGVATRWEDSQLAREQRARAAALARSAAAAAVADGSSTGADGVASHETVRDSQEAAAELAEREEEKAKIMGKDPLGIVDSGGSKSLADSGGGAEFDLRRIDTNQAAQVEKALYELTEELQKAESAGMEKRVKELTAQKESLESLVDRCGGMDAMESNNARRSVLPTNPNFDPILFLTLVHRNTAYDQLVASMDQLSSE
jgi:Exocyst complex component Sec5